MDISKQSQSDGMTINRAHVAFLANEYGSLYFDVVLPATIPHGPTRHGIRKCFKDAILDLTGIHANQETKLEELARFMSEDMTSDTNRMPSDANGMLIKLNDEYITTIHEFCDNNGHTNDPKIGNYTATRDTSGMDLYCIGSDGRRYCYHFFALEAEGAPILMPEDARFRISCVATFEPD